MESGGQSGSVEGLAYDMGEFMLDADSKSRNIIPHNLGEVPRFVMIWTDDFADLSEDNVIPYSTPTNVGYIWFDGLTKMTTQRGTAVNHIENPVYIGLNIYGSDYRIAPCTPTSNSYGVYLPTEDTFTLTLLGTNNYWRAGVTYKYFVARNWWEVANRVE
jgi:hypothetical protein